MDFELIFPRLTTLGGLSFFGTPILPPAVDRHKQRTRKSGSAADLSGIGREAKAVMSIGVPQRRDFALGGNRAGAQREEAVRPNNGLIGPGEHTRPAVQRASGIQITGRVIQE